MALVSFYHKELDRFITFAEEAEHHLVRSGWERKDAPPAPEAPAAPPIVLPPPAPAGQSLLDGKPEDPPAEDPPAEDEPAK